MRASAPGPSCRWRRELNIPCSTGLGRGRTIPLACVSFARANLLRQPIKPQAVARSHGHLERPVTPHLLHAMAE